ncbi:cholecystokinin receptor type A-like [Haliotis cracherodii]|uniref:cholecystokinin receptor type A-like n=1 Tax=Haliotis cracherodii TaxID=6455 RepID=UPI0039EA4EB9
MSSSMDNMSIYTANTTEDNPFPQPSYIVVTVMLVVYSVVGVFGNAIAFYIFFRRRDKSTSVIFILALAGCDFFTCLVIIPYTIAFEMLRSVVVYDVFCKLFMFFQTSNIPFSACIMVAIGFDRYFCICHPFLHAFTIARAKITVGCLALMSITFGTLTSLSFGVYGNEYMNMTAYANVTLNLTETEVIHYSAQEAPVREPGTYVIPDMPTQYENITQYEISEIRVVYTGQCGMNEFIVSEEFTKGYQKVYTAVYIISFIAVAVLYTLIYKSILMRRAKKAKRKKRSHYHSVAGAEGAAGETQMTTINGNASAEKNDIPQQNQNQAGSKGSVKRQSTLRETNVYANIKTAAMLFVVTLVFIIAFLPSWLMAHGLLPFNLVVFYMYFTYNVVNPVIYAFMNQTFREDLKRLIPFGK